MKMKVLKQERCLCTCCMEEHKVKTVLLIEHSEFKNTTCEYEAMYQYCDVAEELFATEEQLRDNDIKMKDAYRRAVGLLTSSEIINIRIKYGISQSDLCTLLGWGGKTITRYESHQVQDKAHDAILKKIEHDPEWFISLLNDAKASLPKATYEKYLQTARQLYAAEYDLYLKKAIEANSYKSAIFL